MKRTITIILAVIAVSGLLLWNPVAMAGKPDGSDGSPDVITRSNGFPSGEHYNLNIHGMKEGATCDATPGGNSVFIDLYGDATIQYVTNRKSSVEELIALDPCGLNNDPAKVQLPYEREGFYVFGRILAKPNNGKNVAISSIILGQNQVIDACNDTVEGIDGFPEYTDCAGDYDLGVIVGTNIYTPVGPETYQRFVPEVTKGKGRSTATDITRLFTYTGWVYDARLDINGPEGVPDSVIDLYDVPASYDGDLDIDDADFLLWQQAMAALDPPMAWYFDNEWILNIADLVVTEQGLVNDGTKLLQVRFYPVDSTHFQQ